MMNDLDLMDAECLGDSQIGDDSWLTIHSRADYTNAVTQLKASADNLNLTAANEPGWKAIYDNALRLYDKYHDVGLLSSINPFGDRALGDSAWNAIADSQRRVDEFAEQLRSKGKAVVEPKHKLIDNSILPPDLGSSFTRYLPWLIGGAVVIGVGSIAVPLVVPLLTLKRLAR